MEDLESSDVTTKRHPGSQEPHERGWSEDEALSTFRQAVGLDPGEADFHFILGEAEARRGRLEEAVASYREAIRLGPEGSQYSHALGLTLLRMQRAREAADAFRRETMLQPDNAESHHFLGQALLSVGETEGATRALRRALALDPSSVPTGLDLGRALLGSGRAAEAVTILRRAAERAPEDLEPQLHLARALLGADRGQEARAVIERAWHRDPRCLAGHPDLRAILDDAAAAALREELSLESPHPRAPFRISPWPLVSAAVHGVTGLAARVPKLAILVLVLAAGYATARLAPAVVTRYRLEDDLSAIAHDPVSDDEAIRARIASAAERHGLQDALRPRDCRVDTRATWRRIVCEYAHPVTLLPGARPALRFRIDVEKPRLVEERTHY
jgi:Flp pilus assembly protein TadD